MLKDRKKKERTTEIADGTTKDVERGGGGGVEKAVVECCVLRTKLNGDHCEGA